jgi:hypothetical protein
MWEPPAYRVLSLSAHKVISRIEVEMAHHGGEDNGKLPMTYDHFAEYGMDRHAIGPAISQLEALGFVEVTEKGVSGNAGYRSPNKYRLTYRHCDDEDDSDGSHEWCRIRTMDGAHAIAAAARLPIHENKGLVGKKRQAQTSNTP